MEKVTISRRGLIGKMAVASAVGLVAGAGRAVATTSRLARKLHGPVDGTGASASAADRGAVEPGVPSVGEDLRRSPGEVAEPVVGREAAVSAPSSSDGPAPWALLRPLTAGSLVGHGWRVADLSDVEDGAFVLTLRNERGRTDRVHFCRNDGRPKGIVYSDRFDLLVMNGGQGDLPTDEGLARAVAEVSHVIAANEAQASQKQVVDALLPHDERLRRFAALDGARLR